jgi:hypothetical protein
MKSEENKVNQYLKQDIKASPKVMMPKNHMLGKRMKRRTCGKGVATGLDQTKDEEKDFGKNDTMLGKSEEKGL